MLEVIRIPVLKDNYLWLAHTPDNLTIAIDPALCKPVVDELNKRNWKLTHILNTHHHSDHTGANIELKNLTNCIITGPKSDHRRIPGIDKKVSDGENISIGQESCYVLDIPGHTKGHIAYHFPESKSLFCGDTLFALGCGRVFEGTMEQMWSSLCKIKELPKETKIYCAHEYTEANGNFALSIEPGNQKLVSRMQKVREMRKKNIPTVPSTLEQELETNPFLRPNSKEIQKKLNLTGKDYNIIFAKTRLLKDRFV